MKKKMRALCALAVMLALVFTTVNPCAASSSRMTKSEKKTFTRYLKGGLEETDYGSIYKSKKQGMLCGASFYVYDINGDGHKDVIVSGALGLRTMTFSEIYMHVDGKYKVIPIRGTLNAVSSKGIYTIEEDYTNAGAERYYSYVVYKFDKHGNIIAEYSYNKTILFYDMATDTHYEKGKVTNLSYKDIKYRDISKKKFKKALSQVNKKKVKMHTINNANIKKYIK